MKIKLFEYREQACLKFDRRAWAGAERETRDKASFTERRLFYLKINMGT
jgi:hypothetical protein